METAVYGGGALMSEQDFEVVYELMAFSLPLSELRTQAGQFALLGDPRYELRVFKDRGMVAAAMGVWKLGFRYIEHLVVNFLMRGGGIGGKILEEYAAEEASPIVLEVEPPNNDISRRRIRFYERHGFAMAGFDYEQPPLKAGDGPTALKIMTRPGPVDFDAFTQIRAALYAQVYGLKQ